MFLIPEKSTKNYNGSKECGDTYQKILNHS